MPETHRIIIVVDRDNDDCRDLKRKLEQLAKSAGLQSRARSGGGPWRVVNRIAVEELEAWYFGGWEAVVSAYPGVPKSLVDKAPYRASDGISGGTCEALEGILRKAGYFSGGLRKVELARAVAEHFDPDANTSPSFSIFRDALREAIA